jgi:tRNA threonylcarbamoyladenosine biosynthesis protein TsaB
MKILAFETATMLGGLAVMDARAGLVVEVRVNVEVAHSERLMTELDHALCSAGLGVKDMDALAVSAGPGSFTGLRIGLSTVKGLSYATGLPVVAVPTLEAFAWCFPFSPYPVCPMLDARKNEVYAGVFRRDGEEMKRLFPERSIKPRELALKLKGYDRVVLAGEGAALYMEELNAALEEGALYAPAHLTVPSPSAVAYLGLKKALKGEFSDPEGLSPFYIRKSEAELKRP